MCRDCWGSTDAMHPRHVASPMATHADRCEVDAIKLPPVRLWRNMEGADWRRLAEGQDPLLEHYPEDEAIWVTLAADGGGFTVATTRNPMGEGYDPIKLIRDLEAKRGGPLKEILVSDSHDLGNKLLSFWR